MRLLLVDGHYYAFRSFYAIQGLTAPDGRPTNAIYGFVKTIRKMLKDLAPDAGAVFWDMGLPKRRMELQPQYKQQRGETPEELSCQFTPMQRIAPLIGLPSIGAADTEADDLIATYTTAARAAGHEIIIATNDKDIMQLVGPGVQIYSTNKADLAAPTDPHALLGTEAVTAKWGVPPDMIGSVLALIGDTVDNIPGIEGIGPKTAAKLLNEHGTLDALLTNLDAVKNEKVREKIRAGLELIAQNREMVRLDLDLPLPLSLEALKVSPNLPELAVELEACGFKSLLAEVRKEAGIAPPPPPPKPAPAQGELF